MTQETINTVAEVITTGLLGVGGWWAHRKGKKRDPAMKAAVAAMLAPIEAKVDSLATVSQKACTNVELCLAKIERMERAYPLDDHHDDAGPTGMPTREGS